MILAALLSISTAYAQDDGLVDDDFSFLEEGELAAEAREADNVNGDSFSLYGEDEDEDFADFTLKAEPSEPPAPTVKANGKVPLSGNFDASVVGVERDSVVVELPVLLGSKTDVDGEYWLVGEVFVDGAKVGETRQLVNANAVSTNTVAYLKVQAPVRKSSGSVEVRVSQNDGGKNTALFSKSTSYRL